MSLPTTVTSRAEGNTYIGLTGMTIGVQTGFMIRTGFYLTNSGTTTVSMNMQDVSPNPYEAFDFISGINESVNLPAGSTKFIPFDFKGYQDETLIGGTGPGFDGGPYIAKIDMSFTSEEDNSTDKTNASGPQADGIIRNVITGYVTGHVSTGPQTPEFVPSHPSGFLVLTGDYSESGAPVHSLQWQHPSTGYYFEKYRLEESEDSSTWTGVNTSDDLSFEKNTLQTTADGILINAFYYGTPTGLVGRNSYVYSPKNAAGSPDFGRSRYYRIRGEHYDNVDSSVRISESDWVYGYPVSDFKTVITNNDILTGLVSGSSSLPATGDPSSIIKCDLGQISAMEIFIENNSSNVNLKSLFDLEISSDERNLSLDAFDSTSNSYAFSGVHFILPEGHVVGSTDVNKAGIETGDKIIDSSNNEVKNVLFLLRNTMVAGRGGDGGDSGSAETIEVGIANRKNNYMGAMLNPSTLHFKTQNIIEGTNGKNGGTAIKITDSSIQQFRIVADLNAKIYGGGGGGASGDSTFYFSAISNLRAFHADSSANGWISRLTNGDFMYAGKEINDQIQLTPRTTTYIYKLEDLTGFSFGGFGGGGQGFISFGGKFLGAKFQKGFDGDGNILGPGLGSQRDGFKKINQGGNGGAFGEKGKPAPREDVENVFQSVTNEKSPGLGGYAIDASVNANYSQSNFRSNLFSIKVYGELANMDGFLAYWDAEDLNSQSHNSNVSTWSANAFKSGITQPTITGGSTKPKLLKNGTEFNGKSFVYWGNDSVSAQFNNIVGSDPLFREDMEGFEIFYVMFPLGQFSNSNYRQHSHVFHTWTINEGAGGSVPRSFFYDAVGRISETAGIPVATTFTDNNFNSDYSLQKPPSSFVYNISAGYLGDEVIEYQIYQDGSPLCDKIFRNSSFSFIDNPILGEYQSSDRNMKFAISDIVLFNKKIKPKARRSVLSYLLNKTRIIKTATSTTSGDEANKNNLDSKNGFAGYNLMNS